MRTQRGIVPTAIAVAALAALLGGCQSATADDSGEPAQPDSAAPAASSPSPEPQHYLIPAWDQICAAAKTTGIAVKKTAKDSDSPQYMEGCKIDTGGSKQLVTVIVSDEVSRYAAQTFQGQKSDDWTKGFAFSGPARDKAVLRQVGHARLGQDYDDAYYAFFDRVQVAGSTNSKTKVVILVGDTLVSFNVEGAEWHGPKPTRVTALTPIKPEFGKDTINKLADAMLALLKPAPH